MPFEITAVNYIKEKCHFILANSAGGLMIVSPVTNTFRTLFKISCCTKSVKVALHLEDSTIFYGTKEGNISLVDISEAGPDNVSLNVSKLFKTKLSVSLFKLTSQGSKYYLL